MQVASLILTILLAFPTLSWAKSAERKGDCNLNSSCGQPESSTLNLNDSTTPIPGLANLSSGIKATTTHTAAVTSESWVSPTNMEPLTVAPTPPPYSTEDAAGNQGTESEKAR